MDLLETSSAAGRDSEDGVESSSDPDELDKQLCKSPCSGLDLPRRFHSTGLRCAIVIVAVVGTQCAIIICWLVVGPLSGEEANQHISSSVILACFVVFLCLRTESSLLTWRASCSLFWLWVNIVCLPRLHTLYPLPAVMASSWSGTIRLFINSAYETMTLGALHCRARLIEDAFGGALGSKWILASIVLLLLSKVVLLCPGLGLGMNLHLRLVHDFMSVAAWTIACSASAFGLIVVYRAASQPSIQRAISGQCIPAEIAWSQSVILRVLMATLIPPGLSLLMIIHIHSGLAPMLPAASLWALVAVAELLAILVIVGHLCPPLPSIDKVERPRENSQPRCRTYRSEAWLTKVEALANRSISVGELFDFYSKLGACGEVMPHYDPLRHTTNDIARSAVIPLSYKTDGGVAYASLLDDSGSHRMPDCMVTHDWQNLFVHLVAAIVADALGLNEYHTVADRLVAGQLTSLRRNLDFADATGNRYWICAFCVNQHASICGTFPHPPPTSSAEFARCDASRHDSVTSEPLPCCTCGTPKYLNEAPDLCELNKFDDMMEILSCSVPGFRHLVAVDRSFNTFTRLWCVAELVQAHLSSIPQSVCLLSDAVLDVDNADLSIYIKLANLRVAECSATRAEDKEEILSKIHDFNEFDSQVQALIFGTRGLLKKRLVGTDVLYAAVRTASRFSAISDASV